MNTIKKLWFADERIFIETVQGKVQSQPMHFFPRLQQATEQQRADWTQSYFGLHWEKIDEDISFESFTWNDDDPLTLYYQN
jgi:uncharacterized protein (DUF2461 family)